MSMVYAMSGLILFFGAFVWFANKYGPRDTKSSEIKKHCH